MSVEPPLIPEKLIVALKDDIDFRRIARGMNRLANSAHIIDQFRPSCENAAVFLRLLSEWSDIGYGDHRIIKRLIATYDIEARLRLSVSDYACLCMAEGMVEMTEEKLDSAIGHFDIVLKLANEIEAWHVLAISSHWMARCLRKQGQYESALLHIGRAREVQAAHGHVQNEVPARVLESLILFEMGEPKHAIANLRDAEAILIQTDDYVTLGNIQSAYGRIAQRELRYGLAIKHYGRAIEHFQKCDTKYANVARAFVDMSFARIYVARKFRRSVESHPHQFQKAGPRGSARSALVKELSILCEIILADLGRAATIYEQFPNTRGIARVHLCRASLHLDMGDLDLAAEEGTRAYLLAESKHDFILLASARILQCKVENSIVEEQIEGWAEHALASQDYARDAMELARNTQDRRLLASAYTWYGITLCNAVSNSRDLAREAMDRAATYLEPGVHDQVWEDFQILKRRMLESAPLENYLMRWAQGDVGDKTFRELDQEFADLVISRAWNQEERKVSRVATRLSISPRKVRRVLNRLGLVEAGTCMDKPATEPREHPVKQRSKGTGTGQIVAVRKNGVRRP